MTTSRLLLAVALLAAVAACKIGGDETRTGAGPACVQVSGACAQSSDCCSYGCVSGVCVANPVEGGACRTTDDCGSPRLCKSGACTTPTVGMCRDEADVCSAWSQCCTGNCEGGACTQNRPPVASAGPAVVPDVPYTKLYTLQNASTDPDGDPLAYGWSFVAIPAGSAAVLSSTTAATPSFTPDKTGDYVVRLVVTDGPAGAPNRYTVETTVTIRVVNRPPEPTATAQATPWSRNVPIRISGTASDPDGDVIECAWYVLAPGAVDRTVLADFAPCANPSSAYRDYTPAGEGTYLVEFVVRDHDRTTGAIFHTIAAGATFVSKNDPPVAALTLDPYYGNMGPPGGPNPAVTLDASPSSDVNGDALAFQWEGISVSDGLAFPPNGLTNALQAQASFVPDRAGDYVFQVTVTDLTQFGRPGASTQKQVTLHVGRYVKPLGHVVIDAARAPALNTIVLAGTDPADATRGMIWLYDPATGNEGAGIPIVSSGTTGIPKRLAVTSDGTKAVVLDTSVSIWIVTLGATPSIVRVTQPYAVADLVVAGSRYAYLYGAMNSTDTVRELDLQTGTLSTPLGWPGYGSFGSAYAGGSASVYRVDEYWWYRSTVNNSGAQSGYSASDSRPDCGGYPLTYANRVWATQNATFASAYVISSCGRVYRADTLAPLATTLGLSPSHVDSTTFGAVLACEGSTLTRLDAALGSRATDVLPRWSLNGAGYTLSASKAFFDAAGAKRVAIVHDTATPVRHGVVTFP